MSLLIREAMAGLVNPDARTDYGTYANGNGRSLRCAQLDGVDGVGAPNPTYMLREVFACFILSVFCFVALITTVGFGGYFLMTAPTVTANSVIAGGFAAVCFLIGGVGGFNATVNPPR